MRVVLSSQQWEELNASEEIIFVSAAFFYH